MKVTCAYAPKKVDCDFGVGDVGVGECAGGGGEFRFAELASFQTSNFTPMLFPLLIVPFS